MRDAHTGTGCASEHRSSGRTVPRKEREGVEVFACKSFDRPRRGQLGQRRLHSPEEAMPVVSGDECRAACGIAGLPGSDLLVTLEASPWAVYMGSM